MSLNFKTLRYVTALLIALGKFFSKKINLGV